MTTTTPHTCGQCDDYPSCPFYDLRTGRESKACNRFYDEETRKDGK
jgi:hypothetical protein